MRLQKYIDYAPLSTEVNTFRAMSIKLTDKPKDYTPLLDTIKESHRPIMRVDDILRRINIELRGIYEGKYSLALCLDEGIKENKLNIKYRYMEKLKEILFTSNSELANIKEQIEQN
jgi:hypothetical protein